MHWFLQFCRWYYLFRMWLWFKTSYEKTETWYKIAIEWFENNHMKSNEGKCHLLVGGHRYENLWANIGETRI